jgi:hypothetical protein
MSKNKLRISYMIVDSIKPTIVSPKTDSHWTNQLSQNFIWNYNGKDEQLSYRIQITNIPSSLLINNDLWNMETNTNNIVTILEDLDNSSYGYMELSEQNDKNTLSINLSTGFIDKDGNSLSEGIVEDGIYSWRIQTKGYLNNNWSIWANDGYLRIDRGVPYIKGATAETSYKNNPTVSFISDLSIPYLYKLRDDGKKDIGFSDQKGMYVYYDYAEGCLVLRCSGKSNQRYYGMLTFHEDYAANGFTYNGFDSSINNGIIYPHEIIDNIFSYKISRNDNGDDWSGASDKITYFDEYDQGINWTSRNSFNLNKQDYYITNNVLVGGQQRSYYDLNFKGIPDFTTNNIKSVYNLFDEASLKKFPHLMNPEKTSFSTFAFNTFLVSKNKKFIFPNNTTPVSFIGDSYNGYLIEMRYPAPFQDVFILFNNTPTGLPTKMLAFGQYKNFDDVVNIYNDPLNNNGPFQILKGFNIEANRVTKPLIQGVNQDFYQYVINNVNPFSCSADTDTKERLTCKHPHGTILDRLKKTSYNDDNGIIFTNLYSPFLYFNLFPEEGEDNAIKIKLKQDAITLIEKSINFSRGNEILSGRKKMGYVEFHMYPETDCSLCTYNRYMEKIVVDDVLIGNGSVSPRDLAVFNTTYTASQNGKKFMRNVKVETCQYQMGNTSIPIESVKTFPVKAEHFEDEKVVFVNEPEFDLENKQDIIDSYLINTELIDREIFRNNNFAPSNLTIGSTNKKIYIIDIPKELNQSLLEFLSIAYGSNDVPLSGADSNGWYSYNFNDIYITFSDSTDLVYPKRYLFKYFRRYYVTVNNLIEERYSIGISNYYDQNLDLENFPYTSAKYLKIFKINSKIIYNYKSKIQNNTTVYDIVKYSIVFQNNIFPMTSDAISKITESSLMILNNTDGGNLKYRILDVSQTGSHHTNDGNIMYTKIDFYPYSWGSNYQNYLDGHPDVNLLTISGDSINMNIYNLLSLNKRKYNGSFCIAVPRDVDYVPYYYPNASSILNPSGFGVKAPLPNIIDINTLQTATDTTGWDSIIFEDSTSTTDDGKIKRSFIYRNDYIKFDSSARCFGQLYPYLFNPSRWGKIGNNGEFEFGKYFLRRNMPFNLFGGTKGSCDLGNYGYSMYYNGYSRDGVVYNTKNRAIYGINDIENLTGKSKIRLKEFNNYYFKKEIDIKYNPSDDEVPSLTNTINYSYGFSPYDTTYTFGCRQNTILLTGNNPSFTSSYLTNIVKQSIISFDESLKGFYGDDEVANQNWMINNIINNTYCGNYIISSSSNERILRLISEKNTDSNPLLIRTNYDKITAQSNSSLKISGDTFSIGNLFGKVYNGTQKMRIFLDVNETMSGIDSYRYYQQDVSVSDNITWNDKESVQVLNNGKAKIKLQVLNNNTGSTAISNLFKYRSSIDVINYQLGTVYANIWNKITNKIDALYDDGSGHNVSRVFFDVSLTGTGYKFYHFMIKDKGGNISTPFSISVKIESEEKVFDKIDYAEMNIDENNKLQKQIKTLSHNNINYIFNKDLLPNDLDKSRTIVVDNILKSVNNTYLKYDNPEKLYLGISENYGLNYNVFSPLSSYVSWDISTPLDLPLKSYIPTFRNEEPDWFIDPNHVKHYTVDTIEEIGLNLNNSYLPGNSGLRPITIIGIMDESDDFDWSTGISKSNPLAKKIYENRDEFIGKNIAIGEALNLHFPIIHIFRSERLFPVIRKISNNVTKTIDGDGITENSNYYPMKKVYIVIDDLDGIAAKVLSRKIDTISKTNIDYWNHKSLTGWRVKASIYDNNHTGSYNGDPIVIWDETNAYDYLGNKTTYTGYPNDTDESKEIVNSALFIDKLTNRYPTALTGDYLLRDLSRSTLYLTSKLGINKDPILATRECFYGRIYKIYQNEVVNFDELGSHNIVGLDVFDRLLFGSEIWIECPITTREQTTFTDSERVIYLQSGNMYRVKYNKNGSSFTTTNVLVGPSRLDPIFASPDNDDGLKYEIYKNISGEYSLIESGYLKNISENGLSVVLDQNNKRSETTDAIWDATWGNYESLVGDYKIRVIVSPHQSIDSVDDLYFEIGWWPSFEDNLLAPNNDAIGTVVDKTLNSARMVKFAAEFTGSFYAETEGNYTFKVLSDSIKSSIYIDYLNHPSTSSNVTSPVVTDINNWIVQTKTVGGRVDSSADKTFYLKKGWHTIKASYMSENNTYRYFGILFKKPSNNDWLPFIASRNSWKSFVKRTYKSIHAAIMNENNDIYPIYNINNSLVGSAKKYLRATIGYDDIVVSDGISFKNSLIWLNKIDETPQYGKIYMSQKGLGRTYSGQIFEEAVAVYESAIFDGGNDLKFWKEIKWNPIVQNDPNSTSVEFFVRTAYKQEELLNNVKKWNTITGPNGEIKLPPFINGSGENIVKFSQPYNQYDADGNKILINRFIQFKMVLKSRKYNVVPRIDDVVIEYSKENSVNFFTTTFNLKSNLLKAIITYNGDRGLDIDGVAMSDIQFGICTQEESNGQVSTNFDNYTLIPINELFNLDKLGVPKNSKFRIGIRFVSSEDKIPTVDEFGLMWESEKIDNDPYGNMIQAKDL